MFSIRFNRPLGLYFSLSNGATLTIGTSKCWSVSMKQPLCQPEYRTRPRNPPPYWKGLGININGEYITHLRFAYIVVMVETMNDLSTMFGDRSRAFERIDLKMNMEDEDHVKCPCKTHSLTSEALHFFTAKLSTNMLPRINCPIR